MERVQPEPPRLDEPEREKVPAERDPARLPTLISALSGTNIESERLQLAFRINELLIAMRAPGNESAEAKVVLEALDLEHLNGLVDQKGRSCRGEAVDTLLACGFPHALNVRPEDLAHRDEHRVSKSKTFAVAFTITTVVTLLGVLTWLGDFMTAVLVLFVGGPIIGLLVGIAAQKSNEAEKPKF